MTWFKLILILWIAWMLASGTVDVIEHYRAWNKREKEKAKQKEMSIQAERRYMEREQKHELFRENEREINNGKR